MLCGLFVWPAVISGVSVALLQHLADFLKSRRNADSSCEGSVGASGD